MSVSKQNPNRQVFNCKRCGGDWFSGQAEPKYCGKCKSSLWNETYTYEVLGGSKPKKKRTAKTGRAAAAA